MPSEAAAQEDPAYEDHELVIIQEEEGNPSSPTESAHDPRVALDNTAFDQPTEVSSRNVTMAVKAKDVIKRQTQNETRTAIDDGKPVELEDFNPWDIRQADEYLRRGFQPSIAKAQSADVLVMAESNGWKLWVCLAEAVIVIILGACIVHAVLTMPARAIPATSQIETYKKVAKSSSQILTFAKFFSQEMESWSFWDAKSLPKRVLPYLDPQIRGTFETKFDALAKEIESYKGRQFYELATVRYLGVRNETDHRVMIFYRSFVGRGENEKSYTLDKVSKRVKVLVIGETDSSDENDWGLQVINHYDLTEAQYTEALHENPWDVAEGKPDSAKEAERIRKHKGGP